MHQVMFVVLAYISVYWQYWECMTQVNLGVFGDVNYFMLIAPALILHPTILSKLSVLSYYLDVFLMGWLVKGMKSQRHRHYLRNYFLIINGPLVSIPMVFFIVSGSVAFSVMMIPMPVVVGIAFFVVGESAVPIHAHMSLHIFPRVPSLAHHFA